MPRLARTRWIWWLHLWLGVGLGLALTVLGASGSALVYQASLERRLAAGNCHTTGPALPVDEVVSRLGGAVDSVAIRGANDCWAVGVKGKVLYVDGATGAVLGRRGTGLAWVARLHTRLLAGRAGELVVGWLGVALLLLCASGLWLWRRSHASTHARVGFWLALPLAAEALTGLVLAFGLPASGVVLSLMGSSMAELQQVLASPPSAVAGKGATLEGDVREARQRYAQIKSLELYPPYAPGASVTLYVKRPGDDWRGTFVTLAFDARTGALLKATDGRTLRRPLRVLFWMNAIHAGVWAGDWSRPVWVLLGLGPAFLFATGFRMWLKGLRARAISA